MAHDGTSENPREKVLKETISNNLIILVKSNLSGFFYPWKWNKGILYFIRFNDPPGNPVSCLVCYENNITVQLKGIHVFIYIYIYPKFSIFFETSVYIWRIQKGVEIFFLFHWEDGVWCSGDGI